MYVLVLLLALCDGKLLIHPVGEYYFISNVEGTQCVLRMEELLSFDC